MYVAYLYDKKNEKKRYGHKNKTYTINLFPALIKINGIK